MAFIQPKRPPPPEAHSFRADQITIPPRELRVKPEERVFGTL